MCLNATKVMLHCVQNDSTCLIISVAVIKSIAAQWVSTTKKRNILYTKLALRSPKSTTIHQSCWSPPVAMLQKKGAWWAATNSCSWKQIALRPSEVSRAIGFGSQASKAPQKWFNRSDRSAYLQVTLETSRVILRRHSPSGLFDARWNQESHVKIQLQQG